MAKLPRFQSQHTMDDRGWIDSESSLLQIQTKMIVSYPPFPSLHNECTLWISYWAKTIFLMLLAKVVFRFYKDKSTNSKRQTLTRHNTKCLPKRVPLSLYLSLPLSIYLSINLLDLIGYTLNGIDCWSERCFTFTSRPRPPPFPLSLSPPLSQRRPWYWM